MLIKRYLLFFAQVFISCWLSLWTIQANQISFLIAFIEKSHKVLSSLQAKKEKREAYLIMKREEKKAQKAAEKLREEQHKQRMAELRAQVI